uniref:Uncharacterized protein n=1 Tax=Ailuropoda melanoleuca TaxID=9646 RepID=A0A7N5KIK2_AILME
MSTEVPEAASVQLQNGQNYFDSGNYHMAKAKMNKRLPTAALDKTGVTDDHIPAPQDRNYPLLLRSWLAD